jgi:hypothetical protein
LKWAFRYGSALFSEIKKACIRTQELVPWIF